MDGGSGTVHKPMLEQTKERYRVIGAHDMRAVVMDVMSLKALEDRYEKEFGIANDAMRRKKEEESAFARFNYDYDSDRTFGQWKNDKKEIQARLGMHWVDEFLDSPSTQLTYCLRVGTTLGAAHGVARSVYLFRTIDRAYTKLHGASFYKIMGFEICLSIVKGAVCGVGGWLGLGIGESCSRLTTACLSGEAAAPERIWTNVLSAFSFSGLFAGGAFSLLHKEMLSGRGMLGITLACLTIGAGSGWHIGKNIYEPFANQRKHRIDDPHWRPWSERRMIVDGGRQVRGRYR
jgi:hypothetical protein